MRNAVAIRKEHRAVCAKMSEMMRKANGELLPEDRELYFRLHGVKQTLEWVYPSLISTPPKAHDRRVALLGHYHYVHGPMHSIIQSLVK